jgi:hypothetical protein
METTPQAYIGLPPMLLSIRLLFMTSSLPSMFLEDGIRHEVDGSTVIDKHPRD